jgi:hypothetical protein
MFVNELELNVKYLKNQIKKFTNETIDQQIKFVETFKNNLFDGINYYIDLAENMKTETSSFIEKIKSDLAKIEEELIRITVQEPELA